MDKAAFTAALEALENGKDLLEFHTSAVLDEKNRGVEEFRRANKDVSKLKHFKKLINDLGWDGESDVEEFIESVKNLQDVGTQSPTESKEYGELKKNLTKLQKDFESAQTELKTEREQRSELQKVNKIKTIENTLTPKLAEEFYGAPLMIKALIADNMVDVAEDGNVVFKQGDKTLGISDGLKWLGDTYSDARKNKQAPGSGSQPSVQVAKPKYTKQQTDTMTAEQAAADIVNFNASLKAHAAG